MILGSKNKGDWSEFYTLLYLLATRKLCSADENLNRIPDHFFPIISILRDEAQDNSVKRINYVLCEPDGIKSVEIYVDDVLCRTMTSQEFQDEVNILLNDIIEAKGAQFTIDHGEEFLNKIYLKRLAAPSTDVTDIMMKVHDVNTGIRQDMGFSIKSYLGGAPTLLNASDATNFVYEVKGINSKQADEINSIDEGNKIIRRIQKIHEFGGSLHFSNVSNAVFALNLMMVDSMMDRILSEMILYHYTENVTKCTEIISHIEEQDPLGYEKEGIYAYKFKKFLCAKALGMEPAREWEGMDEANGGYIAVKSDGEVLAYHLYNRNRLEQYLLDNTKFERASTSRHHYASIYEDNGKMYMKLNLQIRFLDNH